MALRAHCVGRDAHMMPGTEIADKGIGVWLDVMPQKGAVIHFLKGDFLSSGKKKDKMSAEECPSHSFREARGPACCFRASVLEHNNKLAV